MPMQTARFSIVTMMKDEGPRILEWLAYHRLIGFDAVNVYSNDCRDGSDALLDRLQAMGLLRHLPQSVPDGRKPQPNALRLAGQDDALRATGWLIVMDADEFVHVKTGRGHLQDLIAACPDGAEGIAMNWRIMGSNGAEAYSNAPLLARYTQGAPEGFRRGWGVKTLFRPYADMRLGIHRPTLAGARRDPAQMAKLKARHWVNGAGKRMPPAFMETGWRGSAATVGYDLAEIAHFAVQSQEAYALRGDRGNVNLKPDKYDATYFAVFDRNEETLPGLAAWSDAVTAQVRAWLEDDTLRALFRASLNWHEVRIRELRTRPWFEAKMGALRDGAAVPYGALEDLLFTQPLPPHSKHLVREMQARGVPDVEIARAVAASVARLEARRDAAEAAELRAMGITPANGL